jgi:serine/threonine protein kinase
VIFEVLSAIAYCHCKGVIHKDLKPENVMLSHARGNLQDTHTVVVDFGLAEMFSSSTDRSKEIAGTPPFMAPEVWRGNFNKKCDIWSCGVILFYMLSGQYPFIANRIEDFPKAVAKEPPWQVIGGASAEVQHLCRWMLCKTEAGRPGAQELLGDRWFSSRGLGVDNLPALNRRHYQGLMEVAQRSHFEKFVSRLVATQLDAGQQKRVNEAFRAFDTNKDGVLSFEEIRQGLVKLGASDDSARQVADELDVGKSGNVSYTEFLAGVMDLRSRNPKERDRFLWLAWQQFSPDERGVVKIHAVQDALAARGLTVAEMPKEFLRQLHRGATGDFHFEDFRSLFQADESYMQSIMMGSVASQALRSGIFV